MLSDPAQGHFEGTWKHRTLVLKKKPQLHHESSARLAYDYQQRLTKGGKHFINCKKWRSKSENKYDILGTWGLQKIISQFEQTQFSGEMELGGISQP